MSKRIVFSNFNEGIDSHIRNDATTPRVWQFPDRSMTVAGTDEALLKGVSPANGLYPGQSLYQIPGLLNQDVPPIEIFHYGKFGNPVGTELDRTQLPKGIVALNLSMNIVNNWQWDNVQVRAEPYDTDFPMIAIENGGEGVLCHYTAPGEIPATAFHEITRFGGSVDGLSGYSPYTFHMPYNQFKATIFACYESTTTIDPATEEAWYKGSNNVNTRGGLNPLLWLIAEEAKGTDNEFILLESVDPSTSAFPAMYLAKSRGTYASPNEAASGDCIGRIGWKVYDTNSYEITSAIEVYAGATATNGVAPSIMRFKTSATNTAGLTTRIELTHDGKIGFFNVTPVIRQVVPTGSTADQIITALQNLGLFAQA